MKHRAHQLITMYLFEWTACNYKLTFIVNPTNVHAASANLCLSDPLSREMSCKQH